MQSITAIDPFTHAVHGFKELVLKNTGLLAIASDLAFLGLFTVVSFPRRHPLCSAARCESDAYWKPANE